MRLICAGAALLLTLAWAAPVQGALTADSLYEPTTVVAIDLQLPPASVEALEAEPDEYVEGTFAVAESGGTPDTIGEPSAPITVGVRLKGSGSFKGLDGKAAFKVKFNEFVGGQKFLGLKSLTLNNMVQDPSMIREALAYEAFRGAGIVAPRAGYAYVRLNGIDYGLHLNLETMDDVALKRAYGDFDDPQHLYEAPPYGDLAPGSAGTYEVDEGEEDDLSDLEALIAAANAATPGLSERMASVADLAQMRTMWAVERYLGHWDGYTGELPNNHYFFSDPTGVFQVLPWGTDQTLQQWWYPFEGDGGTLFDQCLAEEECMTEYAAALAAVGESIDALDLASLATQLAALLTPWQAAEIADSERAPFTAAQIEQAVGVVIDFLERRPALLATWLADGGEPEEPKDPGDDPEGPGGPGEDPQRPDDKPKEPDARAPTGEPRDATPSSIPRLPRPLEVDRSRLAKGLLTLRVAVPGPGTLSHETEIATITGPIPACSETRRATIAGPLLVNCRLSPEVRRRLTARWLRLRMELQFESSTGESVTLRTTIRLPEITA